MPPHSDLSPADDLIALRAAAAERDPERLQHFLGRLLVALEFSVALGVAAERLHAALPTFEAAHPGETWPRTTLLALLTAAQKPDVGLIQTAFAQYKQPGDANFLKAMLDLATASDAAHIPEARYTALVSCVVNANTAPLVAAYYRARPQAWADVLAAGPQARRVSLAFWTDPATARADVQAWHATSDVLAAALRRAGQALHREDFSESCTDREL